MLNFINGDEWLGPRMHCYKFKENILSSETSMDAEMKIETSVTDNNRVSTDQFLIRSFALTHLPMTMNILHSCSVLHKY
jgi:hypothetical protein